MTRAECLNWLQSQPSFAAAAAALGWSTAGGDGYRVLWTEQAGVNGASTAAVTLPEPIPESDRANVTAYVSGAKWRQSLLSVSSDGLTVTLTAPSAGWTFSADDVIEVRAIVGIEPGQEVVWKEAGATEGATTATITLDAPLDANDNITAYVNGVEWRRSNTVVSTDRVTVTLLGQDGYTFQADDVLEVRVVTGTEGNYAAILDSAFRALGAAEADLPGYEVADPDRGDTLALLKFYALEAFTQGFALAVDVEVDDPQVSKKFNQRYKAYKELLDLAQSDIRRRGFDTAPPFELGSLTLDIYEPCAPY